MTVDAKTLKRLEANERQRLLAQERLERERREAAEVMQRVQDTIDRAAARGESLDREGGKVRRMTGLQWLLRRGLIGEKAYNAGVAYGEVWRAALGEAPLKSGIAEPSGGGGGDPVAAAAARAARRVNAQRQLAVLRQRVGGEPSIVEALDAICGEERTPREASPNGKGAAVVQALAIAGLSLLGA